MLEVETSAVLSTHEVDLVFGILTILKNHLALLDYGEIDTLTGLLNRKTFEGQFEKLRRRLYDAKRRPNDRTSEEPSWLGLVDIDHFKSINDSYGHLFGDEVLLLVSHIMKRSFRGADQLFRFGGEEFVILLEHATEPGAAIAFDRFREGVEKYEFPQVGRVTVSLGYTQVNAGDVPALCVERADAALYYIKSHGRNGVRNCESLLFNGEIRVQRQSDDVELF
jgi:diguanylate cyclase (GGDEF)-like protein